MGEEHKEVVGGLDSIISDIEISGGLSAITGEREMGCWLERQLIHK